MYNSLYFSCLTISFSNCVYDGQKELAKNNGRTIIYACVSSIYLQYKLFFLSLFQFCTFHCFGEFVIIMVVIIVRTIIISNSGNMYATIDEKYIYIYIYTSCIMYDGAFSQKMWLTISFAWMRSNQKCTKWAVLADWTEWKSLQESTLHIVYKIYKCVFNYKTLRRSAFTHQHNHHRRPSKYDYSALCNVSRSLNTKSYRKETTQKNILMTDKRKKKTDSVNMNLQMKSIFVIVERIMWRWREENTFAMPKNKCAFEKRNVILRIRFRWISIFHQIEIMNRKQTERAIRRIQWIL